MNKINIFYNLLGHTNPVRGDLQSNSNGDLEQDSDLEDDLDTGGYCDLYDLSTREVLQVEFPPFYYSTHGLSRPSTPTEEDRERLVYLTWFPALAYD